jgi:hypothetical protein
VVVNANEAPNREIAPGEASTGHPHAMTCLYDSFQRCQQIRGGTDARGRMHSESGTIRHDWTRWQ